MSLTYKRKTEDKRSKTWCREFTLRQSDCQTACAGGHGNDFLTLLNAHVHNPKRDVRVLPYVFKKEELKSQEQEAGGRRQHKELDFLPPAAAVCVLHFSIRNQHHGG